jgi:DNA-binding winged helix-turn-helix (wHTH) protein
VPARPRPHGWPAGAIVHDNTLDQYVSRLRRKLRTLPAQVGITTAHGVGSGCIEALSDAARAPDRVELPP